jgi:LPS export ABC transporter protein LptC
MDARNLLSVSGALLLLGATGYYWGLGHHQDILLAPDESRRPDYVVTDIHSQETDEAGLLLRRLEAPIIRHYDKPQDAAEMDAPVITLYSKGQEAWQITAQHGSSLAQNTEVLLSGQVHAERRDPAAVAVTLDTESLHIFPREERLSSTSVVSIKSPQGHLSSKGINANMKSGELLLNENVTGSYAPAPR